MITAELPIVAELPKKLETETGEDKIFVSPEWRARNTGVGKLHLRVFLGKDKEGNYREPLRVGDTFFQQGKNIGRVVQVTEYSGARGRNVVYGVLVKESRYWERVDSGVLDESTPLMFGNGFASRRGYQIMSARSNLNDS